MIYKNNQNHQQKQAWCKNKTILKFQALSFQFFDKHILKFSNKKFEKTANFQLQYVLADRPLHLHQLIFKKRQGLNIKSFLKNFHQNIKQQEITLYGIKIKQKILNQSKNQNFNIFQTQSEDSFKQTNEKKVSDQDINEYNQDKNININQFSNLNLSNLKKYYLCGCYWILNWKKMSFNLLNQEIQRIIAKESSNQIQNIRIVRDQIKFDKGNKTLVCSKKQETKSKTHWYEQKKCYSFNSLSKKQYIVNKNSISVINGPIYKYDSYIIQVQNQGQILAVRTRNSVYISYGDKNKRFQIKSSLIKLGGKGLYVFSDEGQIIMIQKQKYFIPKKDQFHFQKQELGIWSEKDFLISCQQQMIHGTFAKPQCLFIRVIGGLSTKIPLKFDDYSDEILFAGGFSIGNKIMVIVITGKKSIIEKMYQYQFLYL